ncbi:MAG: NrtA/SsuA/CpmA family ABC transporter substrate-binding protein [Spirochaetia bacterium]|jgi:aliphatic sulfonates family ABC transporter substrate-binding protein|nr:NrtA/SsuA/CpmA family ABC transporter substrate-binding protein [Spirochaetia bacterium]
MKQKMLYLLFVAVAAISSSYSQQLKELNVTYVKSPFNLPSIVVKNQQLLEKAFEAKGTKVNYYEINSGAQQAEAMAAKSIDIAGVINTTSVILANANGNHVEIISGYSKPEKVFALVVKSGSINSVKDLKGKKIAGPKGTVLHQMLIAALEKEGMTADDIQLLQMDIPKAAAALQAGHIDGALLAAGATINAVKTGSKVLFTAEGNVNPLLVIASRGGFAKSYPEYAKLFIDVHKKALEWIRANYRQAIQMGADEQNISFEDAETLYNWTEFDFSFTEKDKTSTAQDILFLEKNGMIKNRISPADFINIIN